MPPWKGGSSIDPPRPSSQRPHGSQAQGRFRGLDQVLDAATRSKASYTDLLTNLLSTELKVRRERYLKARMRLAHLPFHKTLADFDYPPS